MFLKFEVYHKNAFSKKNSSLDLLFFSIFIAKICYFAMSSKNVTLTQIASSEI